MATWARELCQFPCPSRKPGRCLFSLPFLALIGSSSQLLGKIKHVPNHQPVSIMDKYLVGGFNHLENMSSSMVGGLSHILWKIKFMFRTTNQIPIGLIVSPRGCWPGHSGTLRLRLSRHGNSIRPHKRCTVKAIY